MTLEEAKNVIYANVYACEAAGLSPSTIAIVKDACDTIIALADRKTEPSNSEIPNNCEHITEDGVTCAKYPACDDCLDNPLNKVKGSERLVKGNDEPTISKMEQVDKDINVRSKTEPQKMCDADCTEDCAECAKETEVWRAELNEPQTDCAWQNDEHIPTELASTMLKNRFKEQK